jgi:hypothetical protein
MLSVLCYVLISQIISIQKSFISCELIIQKYIHKICFKSVILDKKAGKQKKDTFLDSE